MSLTQLTLPGIQVSPLGVSVSDPTALDSDQILNGVGQLYRVDTTARWVIGDLVNVHATEYGETATIQHFTARRHNWADLSKWSAIAAKVPMSIRRAGLSWSHHEAIARLDPPAQALWLDRAEAEQWSVHDLRRHLSAEDRQQSLPGTEKLPRPPESKLRAALEASPVVMWMPADGQLSPARVLHTEARGSEHVAVVAIDPALAQALHTEDEVA